MLGGGLEPPRLATQDPKSCASTNSAIRAKRPRHRKVPRPCVQRQRRGLAADLEADDPFDAALLLRRRADEKCDEVAVLRARKRGLELGDGVYVMLRLRIQDLENDVRRLQLPARGTVDVDVLDDQ